MKPFTVLETPACPLGLVNVDTDQLIPARFMQTPRSQGYGSFLLHDLRRDANGDLRGDFPLNNQRYRDCGIMIARKNFGCGSSREAAVYVLVDQGITCVIAPSFGDIFASNSIKNGLLPARLSESEIEELLAEASVIDGRPIRVDLANQKIVAGNRSFDFEIRADWKKQLLNGWDDVDMTRSYAKDIEAFVAADAGARPWAKPALQG